MLLSFNQYSSRALHSIGLYIFFYFLFLFLAIPRSLRDLSSLTRTEPRATAVKVPSPNHWTARELPLIGISFNSLQSKKQHPEKQSLMDTHALYFLNGTDL